jgi:hypothetical protein
MFEDRRLRIGLIGSLIINGLAICILGYAGSIKPIRSSATAMVKPPPSRLVEIALLAEEKPSSVDLKNGSQGNNKDATTGDEKGGSKEGSLLDSKTGPMGRLNAGKLSNEKSAAPEPVAPLLHPSDKPKKNKLTKPILATGKRGTKIGKSNSLTGKRNIRVAIKSKLSLDIGTRHLKHPGHLVTGGYHGTVDLRNVKLSGHLVADLPPHPGKEEPNKYIGKSHIKLVDRPKPNPNGAVCIPTGGHTVYASDITIIGGDGIHFTGTKFCIPGGFPGVPGSATQTSPSGFISEMSTQSGGSGLLAFADHNYQGDSLITHDISDGKGGTSSTEEHQASEGKNSASGEKGDGKGGSASQFGGNTKGLSAGEPSEASNKADTDTASQQVLQMRYEQMAKGPLRGIGDGQGGGGLIPLLNGAPTRELHLPDRHNDPTDRVPGALVPEDQRRLVDSPKFHRGSTAQKSGAKEETDPKLKNFELVPVSVGSHSGRGDIPWAPDSAKADKKKPSRQIKGHGKKDGGGDGSGLMGVYYLGMDFQQEVMRRPDRNIDFDWSGRRPDPRIPYPQPFSVRWTGKIRPQYSEVYTLYAASDDGDRIWIDGRLLLSNWTIHAATEDTVQVRFEAGREYDLKIEYFENDTDPAVMKLYWESPSQHKEYIPQSCLLYPKQ